MKKLLQSNLSSDARFTKNLTGRPVDYRGLVTTPRLSVWAHSHKVWAQLVRFWNWTV